MAWTQFEMKISSLIKGFVLLKAKIKTLPQESCGLHLEVGEALFAAKTRAEYNYEQLLTIKIHQQTDNYANI